MMCVSGLYPVLGDRRCSLLVCVITALESFAVTQETYGKQDGVKWWVYWRLFYLACSELFNYGGGEEWGVSHYLFRKA